jgi:hypothetical protein
MSSEHSQEQELTDEQWKAIHHEATIKFLRSIGHTDATLQALNHDCTFWVLKEFSTEHTRSLYDAGLIVGTETTVDERTFIVTHTPANPAKSKTGNWFYLTPLAVQMYKERFGEMNYHALPLEQVARTIATDPDTTDQFKYIALELFSLRMIHEPIPFVTERIEALESQIETMPHHGRIKPVQS